MIWRWNESSAEDALYYLRSVPGGSMPGCQDIDEHHQAESQNGTERRGPVSFEPGLGRNVLEKQIQNTSRGKKHRRADKLGNACRDVSA